MADITVLVVTEKIEVDKRRIQDFVMELGEDSASRVVERATQRLRCNLKAIERAVLHLEIETAVSHAEKLSRLAWQIGLVSLSNVAIDLGNCAEQDNMEGLLVVKERMMRVGQQSLALLQNTKDAQQG